MCPVQRINGSKSVYDVFSYNFPGGVYYCDVVNIVSGTRGRSFVFSHVLYMKTSESLSVLIDKNCDTLEFAFLRTITSFARLRYYDQYYRVYCRLDNKNLRYGGHSITIVSRSHVHNLFSRSDHRPLQARRKYYYGNKITKSERIGFASIRKIPPHLFKHLL